MIRLSIGQILFAGCAGLTIGLGAIVCTDSSHAMGADCTAGADASAAIIYAGCTTIRCGFAIAICYLVCLVRFAVMVASGLTGFCHVASCWIICRCVYNYFVRTFIVVAALCFCPGMAGVLGLIFIIRRAWAQFTASGIGTFRLAGATHIRSPVMAGGRKGFAAEGAGGGGGAMGVGGAGVVAMLADIALAVGFICVRAGLAAGIALAGGGIPVGDTGRAHRSLMDAVYFAVIALAGGGIPAVGAGLGC